MSLFTPSILVAEDSRADIFLIEEAIREHEIACELCIFADGASVMRYIQRLDTTGDLRCPDLLLLDLHLPRCDGRHILERLRASERCRDIPVIVLTSSQSPDDRRLVQQHPGAHFFQKPCDLDSFIALGSVIKACLNACQAPI
ncbi:MAG: response regulator [Acidobacteria bacterium]|nr:response regulator [Acidobacteriota bacterium]